MKIKQIIKKSHPPNTANVYKKVEKSFDENGCKTEYKEFKSGKVDVWEQFLYDDEKRLIEHIKYYGDSYNINDYKARSKKFRYDSRGYIIPDDKYIEEIDGANTVFTTYHLKGTIKARTIYSPKGICLKETHFAKEKPTKCIIYDEFGNLLEMRNYLTDGTPLNYTINTYNDKNQLCREISYSRNGHLSSDRVLKYNEHGLLIEDIDYPVDPNNASADTIDASSGYSRKYFYTSDNLMEQENLYLCGELIMIYKYNYIFW